MPPLETDCKVLAGMRGGDRGSEEGSLLGVQCGGPLWAQPFAHVL